MVLPTFRGALAMRHRVYSIGQDQNGHPRRLPVPLDLDRALIALGVFALLVAIQFGVHPPIPSQLSVLLIVGLPFAAYRGSGMEMPDGLTPWASAELAIRHLAEARWTTGWGQPITEARFSRVKVAGRGIR